jgi:hypothetical protein
VTVSGWVSRAFWFVVYMPMGPKPRPLTPRLDLLRGSGWALCSLGLWELVAIWTADLFGLEVGDGAPAVALGVGLILLLVLGFLCLLVALVQTAWRAMPPRQDILD